MSGERIAAVWREIAGATAVSATAFIVKGGVLAGSVAVESDFKRNREGFSAAEERQYTSLFLPFVQKSFEVEHSLTRAILIGVHLRLSAVEFSYFGRHRPNRQVLRGQRRHLCKPPFFEVTTHTRRPIQILY